MKKLFLFLFALFIALPVMAYNVVTEDTVDVNFVSVLTNVFLPAIMGQVLVLFADAWKYFNTPEWSWSTFGKTKALPFLLTTVIGVALYFILAFVPAVKPFIEVMTDSSIGSLTSATLFGAAAAILDGFTKKKA